MPLESRYCALYHAPLAIVYGVVGFIDVLRTEIRKVIRVYVKIFVFRTIFLVYKRKIT